MSYRKLIAQLVRANQAAELGEDDLNVILECLVSVIDYVDTGLTEKDVALTRPLGTLAAALRDVAQGAHPALFFDRANTRGRPKDTSFAAVQGVAAAAVGLLIKCGEAQNAAATFVAKELKGASLTAPGGKAIQPKHLLRCRDEIGSRASRLAGRGPAGI